MYAAAVELFIAEGFDNVTMDQVAEQADVARQTVFNYFPRKTAFLDEWTRRRQIRASAAATASSSSGLTLENSLHSYMTEMARVSEDAQAETRALLPPALQQTNFLALTPLAAELAAIIKEARPDEGDPAHVHAGQIGLILATSYFAVLDRWIDAYPPRFDLERQLKIVVNIILQGIYAPQAPFAPAGPDGGSDPGLTVPPSSGQNG
ncbi:TetR/AcrR family transcriptional regulator [Streptomyces sp. GD-15H]|uniref:TetR/AcrR family transcriptional regulator n=1 Tax=Streptomyces sp. GD-15H TaxID=3129112 RepID=UPI00324D6B95